MESIDAGSDGESVLAGDYCVFYGGAFEDGSWHIVKQTLNDRERIRLDRRIADAEKWRPVIRPGITTAASSRA